MYHFSNLHQEMNYRKTKTIQKGTVVKRGFSGTLLLLLLLTNCNPKHHGGTPSTRTSHIAGDTNSIKHDPRVDRLMDKVGIFAGTSHALFLAEVLEDSRQANDPKPSTNGVQSYTIPRYKNGVLYFNQIASEKAATLEGDAANKAAEAGKKKAKAGMALASGLNNEMKKFFTDFLQTKNAHTLKHPRFFVASEYLKLTEQLRVIANTVSDKETCVSQMKEALERFTQEVSKVAPGAEGQELVMPVDSTEGPLEGGLLFEKPKQGSLKVKIVQATGLKKKKHYTLDSDLQKKVNERIEQVKSAIAAFESEPRTE
jgi:hypothetical protein